METKRRNVGLAILRIWMCFEVIIAHFKDWNGVYASELSWPFWTLFNFSGIAVPVFMLMSFLLTDIEVLTCDDVKIKHRMYRLIVPQVTWTIVYFIFYTLIDFVYHTEMIKGVSNFWWQLFLGHSINQTVWYQIELIVLTIVFLAAFRILGKSGGVQFSLFISLIALYLQYSGINGALFENVVWPEGFDKGQITYPLGRFAEMVPYAVIGILICHFQILKRLNSYKTEVIISATILLGIFLNYEAFITPLGYGYAGLHKIVVGVLTVLLFYYLPFDKLPNCVQKVLYECSKYTVGVYFGHRMVGTVLYNSCLSDWLNMRRGSVYDCVVIFAICFALSWIASKIPFKWIKASVS